MPLRVWETGCTVVAVKLFAATASTALLLTLCCLTANPASGAQHTQKAAKKCQRQRHRGGPKVHYRKATIYDVSLGNLPSGAKARVSGATVTAVAASGETAWLGVLPTDPDYVDFAYSGIEVDLSALPSLPTIEPGDRVTVEGTVIWFSAGNRLDADNLAVTSSGPPPAPLDISASDLVSVTSAPYDAVLVRVPDLTLLDHSEPEWQMSDGLRLGPDVIGELPPIYADGTAFEYVTGIATTLEVSPSLQPRTYEDLHVGS
jgi:hypothetical protein